MLVAGYAGTQNALSNIAPTFVFITFWVGARVRERAVRRHLPRVQPVARARAGERLAVAHTRRGDGSAAPRREYPARLGRWPAAAGLLAFTWIELVSGWGEQPRTLAIAITLYTVVDARRPSRLRRRDVVNAAPRRSRSTSGCSRGSRRSRRASASLGVRPLLGGLPRLDVVAGTVAFVAVMIGTVTFDGLSQGRVWNEARKPLDDLATTLGLALEPTRRSSRRPSGCSSASRSSPASTTSAAGPRSAWRPASRSRRCAAASSTRSCRSRSSTSPRTTSRSCSSKGQGIAYLVSDPLGEGWDLFGTAGAAVDYGVISQNQAWYAQVACVVAGHVAALTLAHDRALALYGEARAAARSQYAMLAIMVGFTTLALWLLAQAGSS